MVRLLTCQQLKLFPTSRFNSIYFCCLGSTHVHLFLFLGQTERCANTQIRMLSSHCFCCCFCMLVRASFYYRRNTFFNRQYSFASPLKFHYFADGHFSIPCYLFRIVSLVGPSFIHLVDITSNCCYCFCFNSPNRRCNVSRFFSSFFCFCNRFSSFSLCLIQL